MKRRTIEWYDELAKTIAAPVLHMVEDKAYTQWVEAISERLQKEFDIEPDEEIDWETGMRNLQE